MKSFAEELKCYLEIRRSLGFGLATAARILRNFALFADAKKADHMSTDLFLQWRKAFGHANSQTWSRRLGIIRHFAEWLNSMDERHEIPSRGLIPGSNRRSHPYIYSDEQIKGLLKAADELRSINGIRALTYSTLFSLISVTGLRISEAVALDDSDVDFTHGIVTVRQGKFGKERILPVSESTVAALLAYARERDRLLGKASKPFFVSDYGVRVTDCTARYNFACVSRSSGLRSFPRFQKHGRGPRIHDLRHTFAVRTMLTWYRLGLDPGREMIKLTTYLGHAEPKSTYWYIEAVPELLQLASERATKSIERDRSK